jgi:hypothetical protein
MAFTSIISVINNTKFTSKKQWEKLGVGMGAGKDDNLVSTNNIESNIN